MTSEFHTFKDACHPGVYRVYLEEPWQYIGKVWQAKEKPARWIAEDRRGDGVTAKAINKYGEYKTRKAAAEALVAWYAQP